MLLLLALAAFAEAPRYPRHDEPTEVQRWRALVPGTPARVVGRQTSGPVRAWTFRGGLVEHCELFEGEQRVRSMQFDPSGAPHTEVWWTGTQPERVLVHGVGTHPIETATWTRLPISSTDLHLWLPPGATPAETGWQALTPAGVWQIRVEEPVDVWTAGFAREVEVGAGGVLLTATTAWLDGRAAARLTLDLPDPERARLAEVWAMPHDAATVVLTFTSGADGEDLISALAPGRAAAALLTSDR